MDQLTLPDIQEIMLTIGTVSGILLDIFSSPIEYLLMIKEYKFGFSKNLN
jgi:hypothetical protein